jgi:hypothetical protein
MANPARGPSTSAEAKKEGVIRMMKISDIRPDKRFQSRDGTNPKKVEEYTQAILDGYEREGRPPCVYRVKDKDGEVVNYLTDGFHWLEASITAGLKEMQVNLREGTEQDAFLYAVAANPAHGNPRNDRDVRKAIRMIFENKETTDWGNRLIAKHIRCSHSTVALEREAFWPNGDGPQMLKGIDGVYQPAGKRNKTATEPGDMATVPLDITPLPADLAGPEDDTPTPEAGKVDAKGRPIPDDLKKVFADQTFYKSKVQYIGKLLAELEEFKKNNPAAAAFLSIQSCQIACQNLKATISSARPYVVCPRCGSKKKIEGKDCDICRADGQPQGWIPAGKYNAVTSDLKAVAESFSKGDAYDGD